jgi:ribosomal protein S17
MQHQTHTTINNNINRPLSKTVRFNVLKVQKKVVKGAKTFAKF